MPKIVFHTEQGDVEFTLRPDAAPVTCDTMSKLVSQGLFNGTCFYRAEQGFVIQGGLREPGGKTRETPFGKLPLEYKLQNKRGTVTMARWTEPNTATSEFFVNLADNAHLDKTGEAPGALGYSVWAEVSKGMDVVEKIATLPTTKSAQGLMMLTTPVAITSAEVVA